MLTFLLVAGWLAASGYVAVDFAVALLGGGVLIAGLGFFDDLYNLSARLRFLVQLFTVGWGLYWLGDIWVYQLIPWQSVGVVLAALAMLWWINLYNFMDGIDGLAAVQALSVCLGASLLVSGAPESETWLPLWGVLAMSVAGFLVFNWPPARIFMGDVGSCFLGFVIAIMALAMIQEQLVSLWGWIIITGLFWTDATVTLVRRIARGETWHQAHRSHAYQILSRRWKSHRTVTLLAVSINLLWLLPVAWLENFLPEYGVLLAVIACLPLLIIQWRIGAGDSRVE